MSPHASFHHHRRAARALIHRELSDDPVLEERFSPTAVFPGMTDAPDDPDTPPTPIPPSPTTPPSDNGPGHHNGHAQEPEVTSAVDIPTAVTPPSPPLIATTSTTPVAVLPSITTSSTPIVVQVVTTTSTPSVQTTAKPTVITISTSMAPTTVRATTSRIASQASVAASASTTADSGSDISTGALAGGIGAGIVAVAAIAFAVLFFIRRARKRANNDTGGFDAYDFRRSAVLINDPPTHDDTVARGYNPPPPPPMMEHQPAFASMPSGYNNRYNEPYYEENPANYVAPDLHHYHPGEYAQYGTAVIATPTPTSAQHFRPGQNPFSPVSSMASPYEQPSTPSVLTRQPSAGSYATGHVLPDPPAMAYQPPATVHPGISRQPTVRSEQYPADDYVDLSRSSVSPFQAAQYVEISRKLYTEPPLPSNGSPAQVYATQQKELPPAPSPPLNNAVPTVSVSEQVSPFADPAPPSPGPAQPPFSPAARVSPPPPPAHTSAPAPMSIVTTQTFHHPAHSSDSRVSQEELEFPVPPSPALSYTSRYRVDSLPPFLPEIKLEERSSLSSYMTTKDSLGVPSNVSSIGSVSALGLRVGPDQRFVPASSPLANSIVSSSSDEESGGGAQKGTAGQSKMNKVGSSAVPATVATTVTTAMPVSTQPAPPNAGASKTTEPQRPNTVYDPEDAYGGI